MEKYKHKTTEYLSILLLLVVNRDYGADYLACPDQQRATTTKKQNKTIACNRLEWGTNVIYGPLNANHSRQCTRTQWAWTINKLLPSIRFYVRNASVCVPGNCVRMGGEIIFIRFETRECFTVTSAMANVMNELLTTYSRFSPIWNCPVKHWELRQVRRSNETRICTEKLWRGPGNKKIKRIQSSSLIVTLTEPT